MSAILKYLRYAFGHILTIIRLKTVWHDYWPQCVICVTFCDTFILSFQLEIIDACVAYIERLQHQLYLRLNSTTQQQQQLQHQQQQIHQHQVDLAGRTVARRSSGRSETFRQHTTRLHRNFLTSRQNLRLRWWRINEGEKRKKKRFKIKLKMQSFPSMYSLSVLTLRTDLTYDQTAL